MIYEVRTYDLKPGAIPQAEEAFAEGLPYREKYGPIAAFWHTEIGPLNQIIHVWGYESLEERESVRAAAGMDPNWPPKITPGNILNMNSEIWNPAPFMNPMGGDQALGGIYEMRTYTYEPGSIPELLKRCETSLPERENLALQRSEPPGRDTGEKDRRLALWSTGPGPPGEQDHGAGHLLSYALVGPRLISRTSLSNDTNQGQYDGP